MATSIIINNNKVLKKFLKPMIKAVAICSVIFVATAANAQATQSSVLKLMEVTHMGNMQKQAIHQTTLAIPSIAQQIVASKNPTLSDTQKSQLNSIVNDYMGKVRTELNSEQNRQIMTNAYVSVAQKHFTQAEVDAQIEFYGSELGQSIIKKHAALVNDYMITITPTIMQQGETCIKAILPQMEADINRAIAK